MHYPRLDEIWAASEQDVRCGNLDPPSMRLSPSWRLFLLSPNPAELSLQLISREEPKPHVIESTRVVGSDPNAPDAIKKLDGPLMRTQQSLCDRSGRHLVHITSWKLEHEAAEGAIEKTVESIIYGHNSKLETLFMETGPLWARVTSSSSCVTYEVFSPHIALYLGAPVEHSTRVNHLHAAHAAGQGLVSAASV